VKVEGMEMSNRNGTENGTIPNGNHVTKDKIRKVYFKTFTQSSTK
jgi:hypothetical protein